MDFKLTNEQKDIVNAAREFALGEFPERAQEFAGKGHCGQIHTRQIMNEQPLRKGSY